MQFLRNRRARRKYISRRIPERHLTTLLDLAISLCYKRRSTVIVNGAKTNCRALQRPIRNRTRCSEEISMKARVRTIFQLSFFLVLMIASSAAQTNTGALYLDPSQPVDARVDDLIKRMTLEQKASQLINQA